MGTDLILSHWQLVLLALSKCPDSSLDGSGVDYALLKSRVEDVIIKSLIAAEPHIVNTWHQGANYATASQDTIQQV